MAGMFSGVSHTKGESSGGGGGLTMVTSGYRELLLSVSSVFGTLDDEMISGGVLSRLR